MTRNQIRAHGLDGEYNAYSPGNAAAQRAAITSAYKRKRDVVFYYWTPTSLAGSLDLVKLELPPVDKKKTACIADPDCANPQPSGFESYPVKTVVNSGFAEQAPTLVAFLAKVNVPDTDISKILGRMDEEGLEIQEAAHLFLKEHGDTWRKWVPDDVAQRVLFGPRVELPQVKQPNEELLGGISINPVRGHHILKKTVATGFVEGVRARTTPAGRGTSTIPRSACTVGVT